MNLPEQEWGGENRIRVEAGRWIILSRILLEWSSIYSEKNDDVMHTHFHKYVNLKKCSTVKSL